MPAVKPIHSRGRTLKKDVFDKGSEVYSILQDYLEVHKDTFSKATLTKIIPILNKFRFVDPAVDYRTNVDRLDVLLGRLRPITNSLEFEGELPATLKEYSMALARSIELLRDLSRRLADASDGVQAYERGEYKEDVTEYNASIQKYQEAGMKLNELLPEMAGKGRRKQ